MNVVEESPDHVALHLRFLARTFKANNHSACLVVVSGRLPLLTLVLHASCSARTGFICPGLSDEVGHIGWAQPWSLCHVLLDLLLLPLSVLALSSLLPLLTTPLDMPRFSLIVALAGFASLASAATLGQTCTNYGSSAPEECTDSSCGGGSICTSSHPPPLAFSSPSSRRWSQRLLYQRQPMRWHLQVLRHVSHDRRSWSRPLRSDRCCVRSRS